MSQKSDPYSIEFIGAEGGSRTHTTLRSTDFKSVASAIPPPRRWVKDNIMRKSVSSKEKAAPQLPGLMKAALPHSRASDTFDPVLECYGSLNEQARRQHDVGR